MKVEIKRGELGPIDSFTITFADRDETLIVTNDGLLDQIRVTCDGKPVAVIPNKRCTHGVLRENCVRCGPMKGSGHSHKALARFQEVNPGARTGAGGDLWLESPPVFYLAHSVEEFLALGGETEPQYEEHRSLRCLIDKIDRETGVVSLTILLGMQNRRGKTLHDVPFEDPSGVGPGHAGSKGGSWHFITSCR